jgi:hypothetical protein
VRKSFSSLSLFEIGRIYIVLEMKTAGLAYVRYWPDLAFQASVLGKRPLLGELGHLASIAAC